MKTTAWLVIGLACIAHAEVTIEKVWPDKIAYRRDESATLRITLVNAGPATVPVVAQFDLLNELDAREEIARQPITLPAGSTNHIELAWNTGARAWGQAAFVTVRDADGAALDARAEYFSIADNVWQVGIDVTSYSFIQIDAQKFRFDPSVIQQQFLAARTNYYANYYELFAWAPDDFFELAPQTASDDELWRSGTGGYLLSKNYVRAIIAAARTQGIRVVTYVQPFGIGRQTFPMLRKHPDWFAYSENGQPSAGFLHRLLAERAVGDVSRYPAASVMAGLNLANPAVVDAGIDQIVASTRMFGWDGCRFDNTCYSVGDARDFHGRRVAPSQADKDRLTAYALDRLRSRLEAELGPQYLVGHNFSFYARQVNPVGWDRIARDDWMVEDEMMNRAFSLRGEKTRPWSQLVDWLQTARDAAWKQGGHYYTIGFSGEEHTVATRTHQLIFTVACGCHPQQYHYGYWLINRAPYLQFITRFSAFLWDNRALTPLANPQLRLTVQAPRDVLWERFVYERKTSSAAQTIVHLVNPPLHPINGNPRGEYPPPIQDIAVACAPPEGMTAGRAFLLTAEPATQARELPVEVREGRARLVVPQLDLWSIVVFDWRKP